MLPSFGRGAPSSPSPLRRRASPRPLPSPRGRSVAQAVQAIEQSQSHSQSPSAILRPRRPVLSTSLQSAPPPPSSSWSMHPKPPPPRGAVAAEPEVGGRDEDGAPPDTWGENDDKADAVSSVGSPVLVPAAPTKEKRDDNSYFDSGGNRNRTYKKKSSSALLDRPWRSHLNDHNHPHQLQSSPLGEDTEWQQPQSQRQPQQREHRRHRAPEEEADAVSVRSSSAPVPALAAVAPQSTPPGGLMSGSSSGPSAAAAPTKEKRDDNSYFDRCGNRIRTYKKKADGRPHWLTRLDGHHQVSPLLRDAEPQHKQQSRLSLARCPVAVVDAPQRPPDVSTDLSAVDEGDDDDHSSMVIGLLTPPAAPTKETNGTGHCRCGRRRTHRNRRRRRNNKNKKTPPEPDRLVTIGEGSDEDNGDLSSPPLATPAAGRGGERICAAPVPRRCDEPKDGDDEELDSLLAALE